MSEKVQIIPGNRVSQGESLSTLHNPFVPSELRTDPSDLKSASQHSTYVSVPRDPHASVPSDRVSWARIYSLCIANFGINCAWALEFAVTTPYFEQSLNSGKVISHAVWIVGPLSGLIVAPIVGALSDRCRSRFGRRRPFIFAGLLATIIGMTIFSNAQLVADFFTPHHTSANHITAIVVAIISFCVLDLALNTTMWPVRALQGDLIPSAQQHSVQSASIVMFSVGDLVASTMINLSNEPVSSIHKIFFFTGVVYLLSVGSLLIIGKETPITEEESTADHAGDASYSFNIFSYLRSLPAWMWRLGATHALGFFALFCFYPNTSSWLGSVVLGGDPNAPPGSPKLKKFETGVNLYGRASMVRSLIQISYSAIYPWLLNFITPAQLMSISFGVFGILLMLFSNTNDERLGRIVVMAMALPIGAHFTLPVGLTVEHSEPSNRGRYLGALNCFAVQAQLIDTAYTGFVSQAFGEQVVMRIGAAWALLTSAFALVYMRVRPSSGGM